MARKDNIKERIKQIIYENPDKTIAELLSEFDDFRVITDDEELSKFAIDTYDKFHEELNKKKLGNVRPKKKKEAEAEANSEEKTQNSRTNGQDELIQLIREQQQIILDQQKKIQDHEKKLNDIINIFQTIMNNPNALFEMIGMGAAQQAQQPQQEQAEQPQPQPQPQQQPQQPTMQQRQQALNALQSAKGNPLDINRLQEVLKSIAIITSNLGQPRQQASPMDIISNITNSVDIATTIASSIGEGLGKLFDTFNRMQDRAFKSWALKSKGVAEEDIEKLLEQKLEEKLNTLINRAGGNQ